MTAPCRCWQEHYREAERLLEAFHKSLTDRRSNDIDLALIRIAQVHATLATVRVEPQVTDKLLLH